VSLKAGGTVDMCMCSQTHAQIRLD